MMKNVYTMVSSLTNKGELLMTDYIDRMIEQTKKEDALRDKGVIILNDYRSEKARIKARIETRRKQWNYIIQNIKRTIKTIFLNV